MNEIATNDFDYSLLDAKTKEFLEERANIIYGIHSKSAYEIGKQLAKAQKELSTRGYGCFEEWYRSLGFKKTKAYEYINHYNFVCSQNEQANIEKFESLPKLKKSFRLEGTDVSKSGIGVWDLKQQKHTNISITSNSFLRKTKKQLNVEKFEE